ncbi:MAG: hypothetical protein ACLTSL_01715 [Odoribacter splanchnicus]
MKNINTFALIVLFLFSPFIAFLFSLYMLRQNYSYTHFLSFFMGLCAILFPPYADLYRHTLTYFSFWSDTSALWETILLNSDFLLTGLSCLFAKGHIPFEIVRFLFVFVCYEIYFALFKYYAFRNEWLQAHPKSLFIAFLITFALVPFIWIVNGLRQVTACTVMLWATYLIFERHKSYGWLLCWDLVFIFPLWLLRW